MANGDILRMNIYWSNWSSGRFVKSRCLLWTEHQCCCGCKNSKPSFSTNKRPIYIQNSIRCTRDQCRHFEYRYSQNEHILIKLVIKMCVKFRFLWTAAWPVSQTIFLHQFKTDFYQAKFSMYTRSKSSWTMSIFSERLYIDQWRHQDE